MCTGDRIAGTMTTSVEKEHRARGHPILPPPCGPVAAAIPSTATMLAASNSWVATSLTLLRVLHEAEATALDLRVWRRLPDGPGSLRGSFTASTLPADVMT